MFASGITGGQTSLIQSNFGKQGNFEVIAPVIIGGTGSGVKHFWRNNDDPDLPWAAGQEF
jgi:hypothetical protein